jgi:hypothetical protein
LATVKSKGEESPVQLVGDCNPWMSKMHMMGLWPVFENNDNNVHVPKMDYETIQTFLIGWL